MTHVPAKATAENIVRALSIILQNPQYLSVTVWGMPKDNVRVTKRVYGKRQKWEGEMVVKIGKPNYREREFLLACKKNAYKSNYYYVGKRKRM